MTHVLYFGKTLANLQTESLRNQQQILTRVCFPENVFSSDPKKQNKGGEQQLTFIKVICCQNIIFLLDNKSELWAFGMSQEGQLGIRISSLMYPVNISQVFDNKVKLMTASQNFVSVLTIKNHLYIWGKFEELNLGDHIKPKKIEFTKSLDRRYEFNCSDITQILQQQSASALNEEILQLHSTNNTLYILSKEHLDVISQQPHMITQKFVGLACNQNHALAWDIDGRVWSWGQYADGKLGYMSFEQTYQSSPKLVDTLQNRVLQCACGINYSLALDVKGDIFGWGKGPFKMELLKATIPTKLIQKNKSFVKVVAGDEHFGALDMIGQLYVWGLNHKNCLSQLDEEVLTPTLFELAGVKIIDVAMGPFCTVLIIPADRLQKLPNLNLDSFTIQQKKCFLEEANLIRDFTERRNRQALASMLSPVQNKNPIQDDTEFDKANELIHQMQLRLDTPQYKQTVSTPHHFHSLANNYSSPYKSLKSPISFDKIQGKLTKLERSNPLYLPILPHLQYTKASIDEDVNLENLIRTDDDELKYRYIQLVKQSSEDQILMQLLDDKINEKPQNERVVNQQTFRRKQRTEPKEIRYNDKFDRLDPHLLQNVRKELADISKDRWKQYQKKKKIKENKINFLKTKFQVTKFEQISKEEQIESTRLQAVEKNIKAQYTVLRKEEKLKTKMEGIQIESHENQQDSQIKKRVEIKREIARQYALNALLKYLNFESFCQMLQEAAERGLQKKKLLFQANNKAKIIQKAIRKRNIIKTINNKLGVKSKKILLSFIFRIRMSIRIKKKRLIFRKINLHKLKSSIFLKVRTNLNVMVKATKNMQQFCRYYNQMMKIQLSYLNYKWDEYMRQEFKGIIIDKEKEEQKLNQLQSLNEKQIQIMKQLSYPLKSQKALFKEIVLYKKPKLKLDILRLNLLKKIPTKIINEDEQKEVKFNYNNVLFPYTKYVDNIVIPQNLRIRFDYQEIQLLNVLEKINLEEAKLKLEILQNYQKMQIKNHIQQCMNYFSALLDYKQKNKVLIATERMKLMSKLSSDEVKQLKQKEEQEYRMMIEKREINMKRTRLNGSMTKENIFDKIRQFSSDSYPFQMLTYKLVVYLSQIEQPKLQIELTHKEWVRLMKNYHSDFKIRLQSIMSEARSAAAYKARQIKRSPTIQLKRSPTIGSKTFQSKKLID
ncbi:unnamed protein product (macronuclear) [Paramecium tetraurelia]|uniref:Uncharacterized protein n=1 Tax=Paramecium tetraurelia TaxID=5888 RepID=A0CCX8_PARTE|nr:uncharacterized protein GSPATT00037430001 [Paramecium tetraurelia]CAK68645.1 unnamed protein product [Paramecium tetraurelia]|eukprot:XP_001436042.1 hypothetical protein (macronuclear) [Paramecium tetraurelia strain d4-2]